MINIYEKNTGIRHYVGCFYSLAFQIWCALNAKGIDAFIVKFEKGKVVY